MTEGGGVLAWGGNHYGTLGDGTRTDADYPQPVLVDPDFGDILEDVIAISAGKNHVLALSSDNRVWSWGWNDDGQLGNKEGDIYSHYGKLQLTPVRVKGLDGVGYLENVIAISAGKRHSMALLSNGTVWTWGSNDHGQLGVGEEVDQTYYPVQVKGILGGVIAVSAGRKHSLALYQNGDVLAWGHNNRGQLGINDLENSVVYLPEKVYALTNVFEISAGSAHSVALDFKKQVWTWGSNYAGQLGDGKGGNHNYNDDSAIPVLVTGFAHPDSVAAGGSSTMAVVDYNRAAFSWGSNIYGNLGIGEDYTDVSNSPVPVKVLLPIDCVVPKPVAPSGPVNGYNYTFYTYETESVTCSCLQNVRYRLNWFNITTVNEGRSFWSSIPSIEIRFLEPGLYVLQFEARCIASGQDSPLSSFLFINLEQRLLNFVAGLTSGTWYIEEDEWFLLTPSTSTAIGHGDMTGDVFKNPVFSLPSGTWYIDGRDWVFLTASRARTITFADVTGDGNDNFVAGLHSGTWYLDGGDWHQLTTSTAHASGYGDMNGDGENNLVLSIPSGIWYIDGEDWVFVTTSRAGTITFADVTGDGEENFVAGLHSGTWYLDGGDWHQLTTSTAHASGYGDMNGNGEDNLVLSLPSGIWYIDGEDWVFVTTSRAQAISFAYLGGIN